MRIALLCATQRGRQVLERLADLAPDADFTVVSFREEPWEPPYLDDIRSFAERRRFTFIEGKQLGAEQFSKYWNETAVDLLLCVSWRFLLPQRIFEKARIGAFVMHDSLLPAYRGFSPTVWAMINGERETGVTLLHMTSGVDAGDIVAQRAIGIGPSDEIGDVMERVTAAYLEVLEQQIPKLISGTATRTPQAEDLATYTCRRLPNDNRVDWSASTIVTHNLIRAVTKPYPGAFTTLDGKRLILWKAKRALPKKYVGSLPGRIAEISGEGSWVLTGDGALLLTSVQLEDHPLESASKVLNSLSMRLGT